jgi:DNA excision repair protein ERCC-3
MNENGCIIAQSNMEVLLEVDSPHYEEARDAIAPFTELVKSPEHLHTYQISHLSLWNAAAAGLQSDAVLQRLDAWSKYPVPTAVSTEIREYMGRYGALRLLKENGCLLLEADDPVLLAEVCHLREIAPFVTAHLSPTRVQIDALSRGRLKTALTEVAFPVQDLAGYVQGDPLELSLRTPLDLAQKAFVLRDYQKEAAQIFYASGSEKGGSGVIVLPCGSGKTVIGLAAMALVKAKTLILTPNITAARQWIREIVSKTTLTESQVTEYSGEVKKIGDVTVATYQSLTMRSRKNDENNQKNLINFPLFSEHKWGLMIYDEVHLLPAPVFRLSADMQATRRLGLTATLVREDGREGEVFSLIGPKKYDIPWRVLEHQGWIAQAVCHEVRIPMDSGLRMKYALAAMREKIGIAAMNPAKTEVVKRIVKLYDSEADRILVIGQYIEQLELLSQEMQMPLITGKTKNSERDILYNQFRKGEIKHLMESKVGNFAIDLPDANVLIQVSGTFGSRQEEAQRLGRVMRPKSDGRPAHFFSLVTQDTREQEFSMNRQLFLTEQGYSYKILKEI